MQTTAAAAFLIAALSGTTTAVTMASPQGSAPTPVPGIELSLAYTGYSNDTTCDFSKRTSAASIPEGHEVGDCIGFPAGTNSLFIQVSKQSRDGCSVLLFNDDKCEGDLSEGFNVHPGDEICKPAVTGDWRGASTVCSQ